MNLIVSFVVTLVSLTITTINYLKLPLVVGGIVGAIILSFNPAHANTMIEVYQQPSLFTLLLQWLTPVVGFGVTLTTI
jgi:hypothetical protein